MALSSTARGTYTKNASGTTATITPSGNFAVGQTAVLVVAADNSAASGASNNIDSVADTKGNTWTKRQSPLFDNGAASAGVQGAIFTTEQNGGALTTGDTITITFGAAVVASCGALWELSAASGNYAAYQTGGVNTGSTTTTPTVTTSSLTSGDLVVGGLFNEQGTGQTVTGDGDTTNGSWSTQQTAEIGTTAAGMTVSSQTKVVSATATQTYNPTLGVSSDVILAWASFRETAIPATAFTPAAVAIPVAIPAPTFRAPRNAYEAAVYEDNPSFLLPMSESSGNLTDLVAGLTATASGTPTYGETGPVGGLTAIKYDASGDFFTVSDHANLDLGDGPWTIELWFRRDSDPGVIQSFLAKGTNGYFVNINASDIVTLDKVGLGGYLIGSTATISTGSTWRHLAITRSGSGTGNTLIYIDGSEGHSDSQASTTLSDTALDLVLGIENGGGNPGTGLAMAYVAFYKSVLSSTRINAHISAAGATTTFAPSAVAATVSVPAPTLATTLDIAPAAVAVPVSVPAPTFQSVYTLAPAAVSAPLAVPAPTIETSLSIAPAPVAIPVAIPAPTFQTVYGFAPDAVQVSVVAPNPTVEQLFLFTPAPVAIPVALVVPTIELSLDLQPQAVPIPIVALDHSLSTPLSLAPAAVVVTMAVPNPTIDVVTGGSTNLAPDPVAVVMAVPAPTIGTTLSLTPAPVTIPIQIAGVTLDLSITFSPAATGIPVTVPSPVVVSTLNISPSPITIPIVLPDPTVAFGQTFTPEPVTVEIVVNGVTLVLGVAYYGDALRVKRRWPKTRAFRGLKQVT